MNEDINMSVAFYLFIALIYIVFRFEAGEYSVNKGFFEVILVSCAIVSGSTLVWASRYSMPHVTVNGFSGSILGRPVLIKDNNDVCWAIFNTGVYLEPIHGKGKLATLIVPQEQLNLAGSNFVGLTFVKKTPPNFLPPVVYKFILRNSTDFNTTNIYFGKYSEEFEHQNPQISDFEIQIENLFGQINLRDDLLEGRNDALIEQKKFADQMTESRRSWTDIFRRKEDVQQNV